MTTSLLLTCALLQVDVAAAPSLSVEEALEVLDRRSSAVYSFDVHMSVTTSRMFRTEGLPSSVDIHAPGYRPPRITWVSLPPGEEVMTTEHFRQVFLSSGDETDPKRRVEQVSVDAGDTISILSFDGKVRQSYDASRKSGVINSSPPDSYAGLGADYSKLLGTQHNGSKSPDTSESAKRL